VLGNGQGQGEFLFATLAEVFVIRHSHLAEQCSSDDLSRARIAEAIGACPVFWILCRRRGSRASDVGGTCRVADPLSPSKLRRFNKKAMGSPPQLFTTFGVWLVCRAPGYGERGNAFCSSFR
jgi:hypothetical protein